MPSQFEPASTTTSSAAPTASPMLHEEPLSAAHPYPGWMSPGGGDSSALLPWIDHDLHGPPRRPGVPSAADLAPGAGPPDLSSGSSGVLLQAVERDVDSMYDMFRHAADGAIAALKMPPPPANESFALQVLAQIAAGLSGFALGKLGTMITDGVRRTFSASTAEAVKSTFGTFSKQLMQSTSKGVLEPLGHLKRGPAGEPGEWESPISETLLDEYRARTTYALIRSHRDAIERLLLVQDFVSRTEPAKLEVLANAIHAAMDRSAIAEFENQVVVGWLNFSASISLGEQAEDQTTSMPGANQVRGYETAGVDAIRAWRGQHAGFVEIAIDVPDVIDGKNGLEVADVTVTHDGPGAARLLNQMNVKLMELPVFRRITLRAGKSKLSWSQAIVLTPEGAMEVDGGNPILAAIGRGHSVHKDELPDRSYGHDAPSAGELVLADEAQAGAAIVVDIVKHVKDRRVRE